MTSRLSPLFRRALALAAILVATAAGAAFASEGEKPRDVDYSRVRAENAPVYQEKGAVDAKSAGCLSCHTATDALTMHRAGADIRLGCVDCHGGDASVFAPEDLVRGYEAAHGDGHAEEGPYAEFRDRAH
ncbi:MAG: hypothetical protein WD076_04625, partial [Parvularculaceae bacterium]